MSKIGAMLGISEKSPAMHYRLFGLELEMEGYSSLDSKIANLKSVVEDNSLRNNGREFISEPIKFNDACKFFSDVMHTKAVAWYDLDKRCTERGSIHVHVNVMNLEPWQVFNILRLYCLLEVGFFSAVADHRQNNIYCVPLSATNLPSRLCLIDDDIYDLSEKWHKYTALNAKPVTKLGTIEFRHLQATDSTADFLNWLDIIEKLFVCGEIALSDTLTFTDVLGYFQRIFTRLPTDSEHQAMMLAYQEDVVSRHAVDFGTLTQRIKHFKETAIAVRG